VKAVNHFSVVEAIEMAWFCLSIVLVIGHTIFFRQWIRKHDPGFIYLLSGIPGYLEMRYLGLCRRQSRNAKPVLIFRAVLWINVILTIIVFIKEFGGPP
jgi:hypothetical protein